MEKAELIENIFLDAYFGKENKQRDYKHWVKPLNPGDGVSFFCVFRFKMEGKSAILVKLHVDLSKEENNTEYGLIYVDSGFKPETRFRMEFTRTFFRHRERIIGLGIDEIIRKVSPILASKVEKAEKIYYGK